MFSLVVGATGAGAGCADDELAEPPAAPEVSGVEDGGVYAGEVTATFSAPAGELYTAYLTSPGGDPVARLYESGTPITGDGAYSLTVTATRDSDGATSFTEIEFELESTPPSIDAALERIDGVTYRLRFDEPVRSGDAGGGGENPAHYTLSGECAIATGNPVSVALDETFTVADITLAEPGCVSADDVFVEIEGVVDLAGNTLAPTAAGFFGEGTHLSAALSPDQEVNAPAGVVGTTGGTASLALTPAGLEFAISVTDLTGPITAAHFHRGAIGVNGGVAHNITSAFDGTTARGIVPAAALVDQDVGELLLGDLYLNIHTEMNAGGEVRGQVIADRAVQLSAALSPDQEVGTVTGAAGAGGTASVRLTEAGLAYELTVASLSGPITAAHFHRNVIGENGGIAFNITPTVSGNTARGVWLATDDAAPLTPELMVELLLGGMYFNVHTAQNGGGEVRGQILPAGGVVMEASFDGAQEVPAVTTDGTATGAFVLTEAGLIFDISATGLTGPITAAHFHFAPAGENGEVVRAIDELEGNHARGVWTAGDSQPLTPELIAALRAGNVYVNLHTAANQAGEIRGQVLRSAGDGLVASFSGAQENPPVDVPARGSAALRLDGDVLTYAITVDGLTGPITAAHFHRGAIGINGGIAHDITGSFDGNTAAGTVTLAPADKAALLLGELYLNVHTAQNGSGEVRAQVLLGSGTAFSAGLTGNQERPPVTTTARGTAMAVLTDAGLVSRTTVAELSSAITVAHIHGAAIGLNGGVLFALTFADGTQQSLWDTISADERQRVQSGEVYFNVHTTVNGAGEVRGQVLRATD